jgi:hypothetical protein
VEAAATRARTALAVQSSYESQGGHGGGETKEGGSSLHEVPWSSFWAKRETPQKSRDLPATFSVSTRLT